MSEWVNGILGDFITLQRGFDLPEYDRIKGTVPVVSSAGITGYHSEAKVVAPGVVIGRYGTIGKIYYLETDFWPHNTTLFIKQFNKCDPLFIRYFLETLDFQAYNDKSTVPGLNRNHLHLIPVTIPPLSEQKRIAHILGALDNKIQANRQMNATLEAIARAIFQSWFVSFDPIHAKARGEMPYGMDAETADLFPDDFVESELGMIPRGWRVVKIGEILELGYGKSLKSEERIMGNIPVYGSNGQIGWHNQRLIDAPNIVIGRKGNPGTVNWVYNDFYPIDTTFYVIKIDKQIPFEYLFFMFLEKNLPALSADSAVPGLNRHSVYMKMMLIPDYCLLNYFANIIEPLFDRINRNEQQIRTLTETRDSLLPKLISGEIQLEGLDEKDNF